VKSKKLTLGDICYIEKGKIGIQTAIPGNYPLVTTGQVRSSHNEYHFEGEAVCIPLVSATGHGHASIKRIHFETGRFSVGNILCACIPKDYNKTSAKFLHLYFSLLKDVILVPLMQGSANVSMKIKDLEKVELPDVSFERQLEIVDEFERLEVINKKLLTELDQQQTYLQLLRQTILQEAVQGKLTKQDPADEPATELLKRIKAEKEKLIKAANLKKEKKLPPITEEEIPFELPKGWVWCRLGEICIKIGSGSTPRGGREVYETDGIKFLRSQNVYDEGLVFTNVAFIDKATHKKMEGTKVIPNDILLNITGGSIGRCALVPADFDEANVNQHVTIVRTISLVEKKFIHLLMISPYFQDHIMATQTGGNREGLAKKNMELMLIPLPPLAEQQLIVAKLHQLQKQLSELEAQVQQSRQYAEQLLQSVLKEGFEGKEFEIESVLQ